MEKDQQDTIRTAYGEVDRASLLELTETYDTTALLIAVDRIGELAIELTGADGLRDALLEVHGMAHTVINGAGLSIPTTVGSLPAVVSAVVLDIEDMIFRLQRIVLILAPLQGLQVRDL